MITSSIAMPNTICQVYGAYWYASALDPLEQQRRQERSRDIAGSAQHGDEYELARRGPVRKIRIDVADRQRHQPAADAGQHRSDDVIHVDHVAHRSAHVFDSQLVVADAPAPAGPDGSAGSGADWPSQ